ncbi:flagellar hook-associated protein FlgK [Thermovibrio sp.]
MALLQALSLATQALLSEQIAINSTTKNINNAYTDGYSREEPVFADLPNGGVSVKELRRIFDRAIFKRFISANQESEAYSARSTVLSQVESVFNDAQGSGFSKELNNFFSTLNDVALNPDDLAARESFLSAAQTLVGRIRQAYSSLEEIKSTYTSKLKESVADLNRLLGELAKVNRSISLSKSSPTYNQYLDQRDELIKEISSLIDTKVSFNEDGTVNLYTSKGFPLILKGRAFPLHFGETGEGVVLIKTEGVDLSGELEGGAIGGTLKGLNDALEWEERLNRFTSTFAKEVNQQHEAGYDLYGETGVSLFTSDNGEPIDASNITLAFTDPKKVSAASSTENLDSDNANAKALIALQDKTFTELDGLSFSEFYASKIVADLGSRVAEVKDLSDNASLKLDSLKEKFKEISGVNVDEEMIKLTQFQRAYQAAAKVVSVSDRLLETILTMVG